MKKILFPVLLLFLSHDFYGQNDYDAKLQDINIEVSIPSDFDSFWLSMNGCGYPLLNNEHTYMDTFRLLFRKPFNQYLLGKYYCGTIIEIDSITTTSPFIEKVNDSICYVYASFSATDQYYSPYNKDLYCFPLPSDIEYDSTNGFQYFKQLKSSLNDTTIRIIKVCIMMTKHETEKIMSDENFFSTREILLRMTSDASSDSSGVFFCFQPFLEYYSKELLLSRKRSNTYKLLRYRQLYYDLFKKEYKDN